MKTTINFFTLVFCFCSMFASSAAWSMGQKHPPVIQDEYDHYACYAYNTTPSECSSPKCYELEQRLFSNFEFIGEWEAVGHSLQKSKALAMKNCMTYGSKPTNCVPDKCEVCHKTRNKLVCSDPF